MDTVGIEIPEAPRRFDRRLLAGALAATAAACLAGGYALGTSSDGGSATQTIIARGPPATWGVFITRVVKLRRSTSGWPAWSASAPTRRGR